MHAGRVLETCLYAENLEETAEFYRQVLGLEPFARVDRRHVFFRCDGSVLLLFNPKETIRSTGAVPTHGAFGPGHVAFAVAPHAIDGWLQHLRDHGVAIEAEIVWPGGGRSLYFRDPAGNSVELATPKTWGFDDEAEKALRESEARFRALADVSPPNITAPSGIAPQVRTGDSAMISVVLVDDHNIVRQGVRALLEEHPDIVVIGDFGDGVQALDFARRMRPHVLVLDLVMPGVSGLDLIIQARQVAPETQIVVLAMHANVAHVAEALRNGAIGYMVKDADIHDLVTAVRAAACGQPHLSAGIDAAAVAQYLQLLRAAPIDPLTSLSPRERQVLELVAQGHTNAEIAERLAIGRRTVETHRANMMSKLGLASQADVIRFALRRGLLPIDAGP